MNIRIALLMVIVTLLFTDGARANPTPWPSSENRFSIMQTFEITFHIEEPLVPDSMGTWILYGGPTLVNVLSPAEIKGLGFGIELGFELRKYFKRPMSGPFTGGYMGAGALWRSDEELVKTISTGIKLGWRIPLLDRGLPLDLEPYVCVGVNLLSNDGDDNRSFFDTALYLGIKFNFY